MTWDWQDIIALSFVGVAFAYVANLIYLRLRRRNLGSCDSGCFGCPHAEPKSPQVQQIEVQQIGLSENLKTPPDKPR